MGPIHSGVTHICVNANGYRVDSQLKGWERCFLRDTAGRLREEGWRTIQGFVEVDDVLGEARRLRCTHAFLDGKVAAVGGN